MLANRTVKAGVTYHFTFVIEYIFNQSYQAMNKVLLYEVPRAAGCLWVCVCAYLVSGVVSEPPLQV